MKFRNPFRSTSTEGPVRDAYAAIVGQARAPWFYRDLGVPDTPDARFEMVALHAYLVMRRLSGEDEAAAGFAQSLFDLMFIDMDENLREMGVGDLAVGKRIRKLAEGFYGRVASYDEALDDADRPALVAALTRNVHRAQPTPEADVETLADYVVAANAGLAAHPAAEILSGRPTFADAMGSENVRPSP